MNGYQDSALQEASDSLTATIRERQRSNARAEAFGTIGGLVVGLAWKGLVVATVGRVWGWW